MRAGGGKRIAARKFNFSLPKKGGKQGSERGEVGRVPELGRAGRGPKLKRLPTRPSCERAATRRRSAAVVRRKSARFSPQQRPKSCVAPAIRAIHHHPPPSPSFPPQLPHSTLASVQHDQPVGPRLLGTHLVRTSATLNPQAAASRTAKPSYATAYASYDNDSLPVTPDVVANPWNTSLLWSAGIVDNRDPALQLLAYRKLAQLLHSLQH
ncbi:hypothetical protein L1887_60852 [Cichorium endivia]|nr:hypothetical protein L1887_60852 [Cichorium endivia]